MSSEKPFRDMGYLPVKYSSALAKSFFSRDYFVEMIYAHIDNLNLLYVALTRAKKALFINCGPSGNGIKSAGDLVLSSLEDMLEGDIEGLELSVEELDHVMTSYKLGHFALSAGNVKKDDSASPSLYRSGDWRNKIALRKKGGIFMTASGEEKKEKINYGLLVHEILAGISNQQEADSAIEQYYFEGQISKEERELLSIQLKRIFADPQVQDWFNSDWEVKTEALILLKDKHPKRPDRVLIKDDKAIIIDFKTGLEKPADKKQIRSYKNTLYEMGFTHVETYLLYIAQKNVVKVD
jgi:ATP-dependent exoDNAse (exonuclease V) beta subunit